MSTALLTDRYELTMLTAALRDGTADRPCVFEVFARRLPDGRRYGVVAGTGRLLDAIADFHFDDETVDLLREQGVVDDRTAEHLAGYRFAGDVDGYPEGELYFPHSPVLTVSGTFADAVVLETLALSILNHDCAIASAAARMVTAAAGRPIIEMGSRRTHEQAAVAAARAAYLAGFASTSNLEAARRYGVPTAGTAAHAFTLLHDDERAAFRAQVDAARRRHDAARRHLRHHRAASSWPSRSPGPGSARSASTPAISGVLADHARAQLDRLGDTGTRIVVSGDLDEFAIAALGARPGRRLRRRDRGRHRLRRAHGRAWSTSSSRWTAGRSPSARRRRRASAAARPRCARTSRPAPPSRRSSWPGSGGAGTRSNRRPGSGCCSARWCAAASAVEGLPTLEESRAHLREATVTLPWDGLKLSRGRARAAHPASYTPAPRIERHEQGDHRGGRPERLL